MKVSDYIANFLSDQGVTHVFGMSGGAALHLWDSVAAHPKLTPVFTTHEQCAAMAADGYARVSGKLGVAMATSGPGATNLLTGCACSYYDSIPTLMITGQVATHRSSLGSDLRQFGFQETRTMEIFRSVTKAVYDVRRPEDIAILHEAIAEAFAGRPGPVLIDIPDDIQRADFRDEIATGNVWRRNKIIMPVPDDEIAEFHRLLRKSERPVLILGGGLKTPRVGRLQQFIDRLGIPVLTTWAGCDLLPWGSYLNLGTFGNYGPRFGNKVIQNADLVICLGSRLSSNLTSAKLGSFAPHATIIMVDADRAELDKFDGRGINVTLRIHARLQKFIYAAMPRAEIEQNIWVNDRPWRRQIEKWRLEFPAERNAPCQFFHDLVLAPDEIVFADTGANLTWACNHLRLGLDNQLHSAWNFTPMGYALPAAIGAAYAAPGRPVTCIIGDGGLMLCLGELATLRRSGLPIRIILVDNIGHTIQKQTIETWLGSRYVGVDWTTGLAFAKWDWIPEMFDIGIGDRFDRPNVQILRVNPDDRLHPYLRYGSSLTEQLPAKEAAE